MREAMKRLPNSLVHFLHCQTHETWPGRTPLGMAAINATNRLVKDILKFYEKWLSSSSPSSSSSSSGISAVKPWLVEAKDGYTAFRVIFENCNEECALKLLSIDPELFTKMDQGNYPTESPLVFALRRGFNRVVLKSFNSATDLVWDAFNKGVLAEALREAPFSSDDVFRMVLEKNEQLLNDEDVDDEYSQLLSRWICIGKLFPFEYVLKNDDHAPHLKRLIIDQMVGELPLHRVIFSCDDNTALQIAKILVDAYKQEKEEQTSSVKVRPPWLMKNGKYETPLLSAVEKRHEKYALYLLSLDKAELLLEEDSPILFRAIENNCVEVAKKILDLVYEHDLTTLLTSDTEGTALHCAPKCKEPSFLVPLLEKYPELLREVDERGATVLHRWIELGELWPFKCLLENEEYTINVEAEPTHWPIARQIHFHDPQGRSPLHYAAVHEDEGFAVEAVQLLFGAIGDTNLNWRNKYFCLLEVRDLEGFTPVERALSKRREKLAACFMSILLKKPLLYLFGDILFKAAEYNCHQVLGAVFESVSHLGLLHTRAMRNILTDRNGRNLLHLAHKCTGQNWTFMVENFPEFINEKDRDGKTPLDIASEVGATWLVELMLEKDRSSILKAPKAWVGACEKSHFSTVLAFIEKSPYLRFLCRKQEDTPLHHVKGLTYSEYQELLQCPLMKELKNSQNIDRHTPLHKAIENKEKDLAEILLSMSDVDRSIKDKHGKTPMDLLQEVCRENNEWGQMCQIIGVDPYSKTSYIRPSTDLAEMRNIIALVAALLATITFTAAFTLPGGLNSDNGEAILAKKAAFLVFLITNAYAMCSSMLILFCIIWSMVCDRSMSEKLIDRSLVLLKQALYGTLMAFMTGVYTVIHQKSLWAAIIIFVMCTFVVISASRRILYKLLPRLPAADEEYKLFQFLHFWNRKKQEAAATSGQSEVQERTPLSNEYDPEYGRP